MPVLWTEEHLMALPDNGHKAEVINGELCMAPAGASHGNYGVRLSGVMEAHALKHKLGYVFDSSTGFTLKSGDMLSPDISFVSAGRLHALGGIPDGFFPGGPDLVVEVLSPSDRLLQLRAKIEQYFDNGTRLVWVIAPQTKSAQVWRPDGTISQVPPHGSLDGAEVLPGFSLPLSDLFFRFSL